MLQGIAFSFEFPARQSLLPTLVGKGDMPAAVAVNSTTFYTSSFTGPIFGGLLLAIGSTEFGAGLSFITNAICMAWMVGALTFLRAPRDQNINKKKIFSILENVSSGFVYSYKDKNIRLLILLLFSGSFFIRPYLDFLPEFSDKVFQTGKEGLSLLTAFSGIGSIFFAVFFAIRGRVDGLTLYLIYSQIGAMIFFILFAISENFAIGLILLSALGGLLVSSSIAVQSLIQHSVSDTYRARVISIVVSIAVGSPAISAMAIGWLSKYLGLQNSLIISGIIGIVITVLLSIKLMKRQHEIES
jgi:MFS family permease